VRPVLYLNLSHRWVVILAGRQFGSEHVKEYIIKKRYIGQPILADELLV